MFNGFIRYLGSIHDRVFRFSNLHKNLVGNLLGKEMTILKKWHYINKMII